MKKTYFIPLFLVALISAILFQSCRFGCVKGSGNQVTQNFKMEKFGGIEVSGGFKVNLKQDSSYKVDITGDDNLMKYIHAEVEDGKLHIYSKKNFCSSGEIIVNIGAGSLDMIKGSGAVNFTSDSKLNTGDLKLDLSGASKVDLDLNAGNVTTEGSGASEIDLKGQATSYKLELTGSGKIHAFDFVVGKYDIRTTGASDCEINVLTDLNVNTTGASDIKYRGNPANVNSTKTGASTLTKVN